MNCELIKESPYKPYQAKLDYDENTIGCGVVLEYVGKQGEEKIKNYFRGEMSALYFIDVSAKSLPAVHALLTSTFVSHVGMENLVQWLAYQQVEVHKPGKTGHDAGIIEKIFMHINPKYTGRMSQSKRRVYAYYKGSAKNVVDIFNHVERVYQEARIEHNTPAKEVFLNIGGIKILMPLLYQLAEYDTTPERHQVT